MDEIKKLPGRPPTIINPIKCATSLPEDTLAWVKANYSPNNASEAIRLALMQLHWLRSPKEDAE